MPLLERLVPDAGLELAWLLAAAMLFCRLCLCGSFFSTFALSAAAVDQTARGRNVALALLGVEDLGLARLG